MHVKELTPVARRCIEISRARKFVNERVHQVEIYTIDKIIMATMTQIVYFA